MGNFLRDKKTDHLAWAHRVKDVFVDHSLTQIDAETDPDRCSLGKWMNSAAVPQLRKDDARFDTLIAQLDGPTGAFTSVPSPFRK